MTTKARPIILWLRRDLRLGDNPALRAAMATKRPIIPVYILDPEGHGRRIGGAGRWWLDRSLRALSDAIAARGGRLLVRTGPSEPVLRGLINQTGADTVLMNRLFEPDADERDAAIAHGLKADGLDCRAFNAAYLVWPGSITTGEGKPYKVFTPFSKALDAAIQLPPHTPGPNVFEPFDLPGGESIDDLGLAPSGPDWATGFDWTPGEAGAAEALLRFIASGLPTYSTGRDHPAEPGASRLSPHLHWGEIAPWRVLQRVRDAAAEGKVPAEEAAKFASELAWREFSIQLLTAFPYIVDRAFRPDYDAMPWRDDEAGFRAWTRGQTGYPIVDAGMRQLWTTGWMHNRLRMIVASFLVKDLLIDWRKGETWFRDTLVDADLGNNVQNWQWVAGSGADAAPYFRIYNPVSQGERFDADGRYVRKWVPELAGLPDRWVHQPWNAPGDVLARAGVELGRTYPRPIVDHAEARVRALGALRGLRGDRPDPD